MVLALALPLTSLAQEMGLDLSGESESPKSEDTQQTQDAAYEAALEAPATGSAIQAKPDARTTSEAPVTGKAGSVQDLTDVERDITHEDRVKSIQRKVFLKTHRFELLPTIFVSVNDPYYSKWGGALRGSFFLSDTLAIAVHASVYDLLPTDDVRTAKANFQSRIFYSVPKWSVLGAVEWSPIYGKATIFNSIIHFDGFILRAGWAWCNTDVHPRSTPRIDGRRAGRTSPAEFGIGLRFMTTDWLSVNLALIDTDLRRSAGGHQQGSDPEHPGAERGHLGVLPVPRPGGSPSEAPRVVVLVRRWPSPRSAPGQPAASPQPSPPRSPPPRRSPRPATPPRSTATSARSRTASAGHRSLYGAAVSRSRPPSASASATRSARSIWAAPTYYPSETLGLALRRLRLHLGERLGADLPEPAAQPHQRGAGRQGPGRSS